MSYPIPTPENARVRLIGQADHGDITVPNNDTALATPPIEQRCTFTPSPFIGGNFVAPVAGFYDFHASALIESPDGYSLLAIQSDGTQAEARSSAGGGTVSLSCTLYLNAAQEARIVAGHYGGTTDATLRNNPNSFFYEVALSR